MEDNQKETYHHKNLEKKWKELWFRDNIYAAVDFSEKPKKYILAELPYPSGKSLHVGHMMRYTVPEIYSRFLRMNGYNVLFPMGWDCFGLPAETYAIKQGITPQEAIAQATKDYKAAMQDMGYAIDWDREINTSDPTYYKWTQWMFMKLWEKGLAIQQEMPVWWCKELGVLADEEVLPSHDGKGRISERGSYVVERKSFKQWVLNIPAYADRLIKDLDLVDYQEPIKVAQKNWIGKKDGALVDFKIDGQNVSIFTTRLDTIFGVSFIALAPTHPLISQLLYKIENAPEVKEYIERSANLLDMEKQTKEKTGVCLKGLTATHPLDENINNIPVFVADYILGDFGAGAIMGVPAHDERDFAFAKKYGLKIVKVVESDSKAEFYEGEGVAINSGKYDGMLTAEFKETIITELEKTGQGERSKTYKIRPQVFSRQRYWGEPIPLIYKENGQVEAMKETDLPLELPVMKDFLAGDDGVSPLTKNEAWVKALDSKGNPAKHETDTMPTWAGSNWYYMRYIDPKNDKAPADMEKLKYWMPVDMYFGDAGHTTAHLLYSRFWYKFLYDIGVVPHSEPYNFRMSGGMLLGSDGHKMSKSKGNVINPQEILETHGADAVRTYLAFIGPYEETYPWNPRGLAACAKLVKSIYELKTKVTGIETEKETVVALNKAIKNITEMANQLKMNTSVSEIMILTNHLKTVGQIPESIWKEFIKIIAPFMPFMAEELWQETNKFEEWKPQNSIHLQDWPKYNEKSLVEETVKIAVQVNGKVRAVIEAGMDETQETVLERALAEEKIKSNLGGKEPSKVIYVRGKILNLVA